MAEGPEGEGGAVVTFPNGGPLFLGRPVRPRRAARPSHESPPSRTEPRASGVLTGDEAWDAIRDSRPASSSGNFVRDSIADEIDGYIKKRLGDVSGLSVDEIRERLREIAAEPERIE